MKGQRLNIKRLEEVANLYVQMGTLQAAGELLGVTRERVRQILARGRALGLHNIWPGEERRAVKVAEDEAKAEERAEQAWERDPVRRLYELSRELGYVPSTTTLQWGHGRTGGKHGFHAGPYYAILAALRKRGVRAPDMLDEISAITGLPRERRQHDWAPTRCTDHGDNRFPSGGCRVCHALSYQRRGKPMWPKQRAVLAALGLLNTG